jgi:hypothetical protein
MNSSEVALIPAVENVAITGQNVKKMRKTGAPPRADASKIHFFNRFA